MCTITCRIVYTQYTAMPMPLENKHLENLDDRMIENEQFKSMYVDQIENARDSIFQEMCNAVKVTDFDDLRADCFNQKNISKAQLCGWLETVCYILNTYAVPVLNSGSSLPDDISMLKDEKISDQKDIIDLQQKLIVKKDEDMKMEMKSYSTVVRKSCAEALAPKKIKTAIKKAADEQDRDKNIIIYGMKEENGENVESKVNKLLDHLNEKPRISKCCRIGNSISDRVKPIRFSLDSSDVVKQILQKSKELKNMEGSSKVYLCPDRSFEDRLIIKKLVTEIKQKRTNEPNKVHFIRNTKIVSYEKDA